MSTEEKSEDQVRLEREVSKIKRKIISARGEALNKLIENLEELLAEANKLGLTDIVTELNAMLDTVLQESIKEKSQENNPSQVANGNNNSLDEKELKFEESYNKIKEKSDDYNKKLENENKQLEGLITEWDQKKEKKPEDLNAFVKSEKQIKEEQVIRVGFNTLYKEINNKLNNNQIAINKITEVSNLKENSKELKENRKKLRQLEEEREKLLAKKAEMDETKAQRDKEDSANKENKQKILTHINSMPAGSPYKNELQKRFKLIREQDEAIHSLDPLKPSVERERITSSEITPPINELELKAKKLGQKARDCIVNNSSKAIKTVPYNGKGPDGRNGSGGGKGSEDGIPPR